MEITMGIWIIMGVIAGIIAAGILVWISLHKLKKKTEYINNEVKSKNVKERAEGFKQRIGNIEGKEREPDNDNSEPAGKEGVGERRSIQAGTIKSPRPDCSKPGKDNISKENASCPSKEKGRENRDTGDNRGEPGEETGGDTGGVGATIELIIE